MMGSMGDLSGFGFWMFITAVVVGSMWCQARKRETQQDTLRRLVESGKDIDEAVLEKILAVSNKDNRNKDSSNEQELTTAGVIMLFISPGLLVLGYFMQGLNEVLLTLLAGVAGLVAFVGIGLLVAGRVAKHSYNDDKG
jgi:hypothetical protein